MRALTGSVFLCVAFNDGDYEKTGRVGGVGDEDFIPLYILDQFDEEC